MATKYYNLGPGLENEYLSVKWYMIVHDLTGPMPFLKKLRKYQVCRVITVRKINFCFRNHGIL